MKEAQTNIRATRMDEDFLSLVEPISEQELKDRLTDGRSSGAAFLACSEMGLQIPGIPSEPELPVRIWQSFGCHDADQSSVEGVLLLNKVSDVIAYGHYPCDFISTTFGGAADSAPPLSDAQLRYLKELRNVKRLLEAESPLSAYNDPSRKLLQYHVLNQLLRLTRSVTLARAIAKKEIRLHAWLRMEESSELLSYHPKESIFISVQ